MTTTSDERRWNREGIHTSTTTANSSTSLAEVVDGALDKVGSIIRGDDLHPVGQAGFELGQPCLDPVDGVLGISRQTHDDDAAHPSFAVGSAIPRRLWGPVTTSATSPSSRGARTWCRAGSASGSSTLLGSHSDEPCSASAISMTEAPVSWLPAWWRSR